MIVFIVVRTPQLSVNTAYKDNLNVSKLQRLGSWAVLDLI